MILHVRKQKLANTYRCPSNRWGAQLCGMRLPQVALGRHIKGPTPTPTSTYHPPPTQPKLGYNPGRAIPCQPRDCKSCQRWGTCRARLHQTPLKALAPFSYRSYRSMNSCFDWTPGDGRQPSPCLPRGHLVPPSWRQLNSIDWALMYLTGGLHHAPLEEEDARGADEDRDERGIGVDACAAQALDVGHGPARRACRIT